jgi:hypothetical protein
MYLAVDGDDVGKRIELLIVSNQIEMLSVFFNSFQSSMAWLSENIANDFNASIIFSGGDGLLADFPFEELSIEKIENIRDKFSLLSQTTISIGIGESPRQAYFALKLAKAMGKNRVEVFRECNK